MVPGSRLGSRCNQASCHLGTGTCWNGTALISGVTSPCFSQLVLGLKRAPFRLTSMSPSNPRAEQTPLQPVFLLVLPPRRAPWGCLAPLSMGHLPTLPSLGGAAMPILTSE